MIIKQVYASIPGVTGIEQINVSQSYGQTSAVAQITCTSTSLDLNDPISIDLGYDDDHGTIFTGRIKAVERSRAEGTIKLTCRDILVDAADYFLVADNPEQPWSRSNISAEDAVGDLLAEAGITNYSPNVPLSFTYAIHAPLEFNLISIMDAIGEICRTLVWHVYADNEIVYFTDVKPYYRSGNDKDTEYGQMGNTDDVISHYISNDNIIDPPARKKIIKNLEYTFSDDDLRNRVVVYGREGVAADASIPSPYLPPDFYKTAVIASSLIDSSEMAAQTANFNLALYNRLTETVNLECLGDRTIKARQFVNLVDATTGVSGNWFVETASHTIGKDGYVVRLALRK